jgi:hypothetical protein
MMKQGMHFGFWIWQDIFGFGDGDDGRKSLTDGFSFV